jgi:D-lactate dehydrogenase (cytochrome)
VTEHADAVREIALGERRHLISSGRRRQKIGARLWQARHNTLYARPRDASRWQDVDDRCVRADFTPGRVRPGNQARSSGFVWRSGALVGHAGDGNFHLNFVFEIRRPRGSSKRSTRLNARLVERAIAMGGTSTGEHGVGLGKIGLPYERARRRGGRRHARESRRRSIPRTA